MPQFLQHTQINKQWWDTCVEASAQRIVYGLSWYLDVVAPGWGAVVEEQAGKYITVMPVPLAQKWGFTFVFQPFFCQQLGIFSITEVYDANAFLRVLQQHFAYIREYSFNTGNTFSLDGGKEPTMRVEQFYTHHLHLELPYAQLYRQYSRDRKMNLKRAQKAGLVITESTDVKPLINLFREDAESRIYGGVAPATYTLLEHLYKALRARGLATLQYTYTPNGELDAGCLFITYAQKIIYIFNAASKTGRRRNGRSLMIDSILQQYAGQPYVFDFESPPTVSNIIRVYHGFGSVPVPFYTIARNQLPLPIKVIKETRRLFFQQVLPTFGFGEKP